MGAAIATRCRLRGSFLVAVLLIFIDILAQFEIALVGALNDASDAPDVVSCRQIDQLDTLRDAAYQADVFYLDADALPPVVMTSSLSSSSTVSAPMITPVLVVTFIVRMPMPPRPCGRYSSSCVRLP